MFKNLHKNKYNKGVTLIELLVVIAIFMVISSITIFSYGKFNSSLSIQNLADDIALSVRRAQGYAIGVRGQGGVFGEGYGIHFTADSTPSLGDLYAGSNKSFILFVDMSANNQYNYNASKTCGAPTSANECLDLLRISTTDKIANIYLNNSATPINSEDSVDLIFKRPNPTPTFCHRVGGVGSCASTAISSIQIKISQDVDPNIFKVIYISNNGQISISN